MQTGEAISVQAIRLLPWDLGCPIDSSAKSQLLAAASRLQGWEVLAEPKEDQGAVLLLRHESVLLCVEVYVYDDGIGLIELLEMPVLYDSSLDFDPEVHAARKREVGAKLLSNSHDFSSEIRCVVEALRSAVKPWRMRASAGDDWEQGGFAYVFSFHLISMQSDANLGSVSKKASRLLNPIRPMMAEDVQGLAAFDLTRGLANEASETRVIELGHGLVLQSTWATLCAIGRMADADKRKIRNLERLVQRHWFYCYVAQHHLKSLIADLRRSLPAAGLAVMGDVAVDAQLVSIRLRDFRSAMATQAELDAYDELLRTSRLNQASAQLDALVQIFLSRLSNYVEQKRLVSTRIIEVAVVVLAVVSATADFTAILKEDGWRSSPVVFLATIFCLISLAIVVLRYVRKRKHN